MFSCFSSPEQVAQPEVVALTVDGDDLAPLDTLTFLSYNVGLLRLRLLGATVFANPPFANERLPHIPKAIRTYPADVLAIQECYEHKHAEFLWNELKDIYPYHSRVESGGFIKFHNGLLILSKYPIVRTELQPYQKVAALEYYLATKSSLIVDVLLPGLGKVTLVNMHTTAGGHTDPEHPDVDGDREDELRQAAEACDAATAEGRLGVILGDLNCGPEASEKNFAYILNRGYRDTYAEAKEVGKVPEGEHFTWDPTNYLNTIGPHSHSPGQRCDHVLLPAKGMEDWVVDQAKIVFEEKSVDIGGGRLSTLSDHHGLYVVLKRQSAADPTLEKKI